MQEQPLTHTFDPDELLADLNLVIQENGLTTFDRNRMRREINKAHRKGRLATLDLTGTWAWRLCCASLMRHRYHWCGWQFRDDWAVRVTTRPWLYPRWDGRACRLLVIAEQGLGDEVLAASVFDELARDCPDAVIECDSRLIPIFERSFAGSGLTFVDRFKGVARTRYKLMERRPGQWDAFVPAMALLPLYRRHASHFPRRPYLTPDYGLALAYRDQIEDMPGRPVVGITWTQRIDRIDPEIWRRKVPGDPVFVNLNYDGTRVPWALDVEQPTLDHTFALIAALDRVYTIEQTVFDMAGALGMPITCVRPPPIYGDVNNRMRWRIGADMRCDWYANVKTYRNIAQYERSGRGTRRDSERPRTAPHASSTVAL